ncbi:chain length determinant protein tyrosine kinase EpsG [Caldimonas caldifontis]|uniref:Chain length determinant protein tyrosine kinase EpsG n=1 Tax=Caldimonas caldifontis TaxID=1452508 RepID=A0A2S5SQE2_9BURK|nr:chain length determinant protein tyrosine kinase EpsG [Caldimonas caldifontis]PPE64933.1 chain length determinant protein tyrosine kinase EpsG [Caldimonas caldifontis]
MKMSMSVVPSVQRMSRPIGAILVDAGKLSAQEVEQVLQAQRQHDLRFGDTAVKLGLLTTQDVQHALAEQFAFPYLRASDHGRAMSEDLEAAYQPFGSAAERIRSLRSQLMLHWFSKTERRQILCVVGAQPGEGRSYLAANLAIVFAQAGERTLLIDANLRRPRIHDMFALNNRSGLSTLLSGRTGNEAIVHITELAGLFVLPSGPTPPNPVELLGQVAFADLLNSARASFDIVIIDTPGLSDGDDAILVTARAGAALTVARSRHTKVEAFRSMLAEMKSMGVVMTGTVLNDIPANRAVAS